MESNTSETQNEARARLSAALERYCEIAFHVDFRELLKAIDETNESTDNAIAAWGESFETEEDEGQERLEYLEDYFNDGPPDGPETISQIQGITISQLKDPDMARRILPVLVQRMSVNKPEEIANLQSRVQSAAETGENATLPADFVALTTLTYSIYPPGLPRETSGMSWHRLPGKVLPLENLIERFHMAEAGFTTFAGFVNDPHSGWKWPPLFAWILCERAAGEGRKARPKGWRIVYAALDFGPMVFESVEEFLNWYAGFEISETGGWDEESGQYEKEWM